MGNQLNEQSVNQMQRDGVFTPNKANEVNDAS